MPECLIRLIYPLVALVVPTNLLTGSPQSPVPNATDPDGFRVGSGLRGDCGGSYWWIGMVDGRAAPRRAAPSLFPGCQGR